MQNVFDILTETTAALATFVSQQLIASTTTNDNLTTGILDVCLKLRKARDIVDEKCLKKKRPRGACDDDEIRDNDGDIVVVEEEQQNNNHNNNKRKRGDSLSEDVNNNNNNMNNNNNNNKIEEKKRIGKTKENTGRKKENEENAKEKEKEKENENENEKKTCNGKAKAPAKKSTKTTTSTKTSTPRSCTRATTKTTKTVTTTTVTKRISPSDDDDEEEWVDDNNNNNKNDNNNDKNDKNDNNDKNKTETTTTTALSETDDNNNKDGDDVLKKKNDNNVDVVHVERNKHGVIDSLRFVADPDSCNKEVCVNIGDVVTIRVVGEDDNTTTCLAEVLAIWKCDPHAEDTVENFCMTVAWIYSVKYMKERVFIDDGEDVFDQVFDSESFQVWLEEHSEDATKQTKTLLATKRFFDNELLLSTHCDVVDLNTVVFEEEQQSDIIDATKRDVVLRKKDCKNSMIFRFRIDEETISPAVSGDRELLLSFEKSNAISVASDDTVDDIDNIEDMRGFVCSGFRSGAFARSVETTIARFTQNTCDDKNLIAFKRHYLHCKPQNELVLKHWHPESDATILDQKTCNVKKCGFCGLQKQCSYYSDILFNNDEEDKQRVYFGRCCVQMFKQCREFFKTCHRILPLSGKDVTSLHTREVNEALSNLQRQLFETQ